MGDLKFFLLDTDYVVVDGRPVMRLWGKAEDGRTVLALDRNFEPYFYVELAEKYTSLSGLDGFRDRINSIADLGSKVKGMELVEKKYLGEPRTMLKITLHNPRDIPYIRE